MLLRLAALVAPPACVACRRPPPDPLAVLCPACAAALPWLAAVCGRCALPRCGGGPACPARDAPWAAAWAPLAHAGPARALVHALKFRGALRVAELMAAQVAAAAPPWAPWSGTPGASRAVLVPVPPDPFRARRRGLDHARLLAEALGRRTGLRVGPCLRARAGPRQVGAGRAGRREAVAARVRPRTGAVVPLRAVLVDDVHTTGATLRACAGALRAAGTASVLAVTYARALPTG